MKLVFLHGRSQSDKNPLVLRQRWVSALHHGLDEAGLELPIDEHDIIFPFYGDALRDATSPDANALAMVRYPLRERVDEFHCEAVSDCLERAGITPQLIASSQRPSSDDDGRFTDFITSSLSNEWVQRGLSLFDRHFPEASARSLESTVGDVSLYLQDENVQAHIENGVARAFAECGGERTVVVGHSLGSVVAYRMLREGGLIDCPIEALITIGSPLGVGAIRRALEPIAHPPAVNRWFNAYDERDVVALNPLDHEYFPVAPMVSNFGGIVNASENHHNIRGYLGSPVVARWIVQALTEYGP